MRFNACLFDEVTNNTHSDASGDNVLCQIFLPKILCGTRVRRFKLKPYHKKKKK